MDIADLSPAQCILLAVHLASESNVKALYSFTPARLDALDPELVLRILLTYLPESLEPKEYTGYVEEVASRLYLDVDREEVAVDTTPVKDVSDAEAQRRVKQLHLRQIIPPSFPPHATKDLLTRFICHRAYRIDAETGMLNLLPSLIEPFLNRNQYIRTWYISVVLPMLRYSQDYYPEEEAMAVSLSEFEKLSGKEGIQVLLRRAAQPSSGGSEAEIARDIKGLVGPWMYGHTDRKRRKLDGDSAGEDPSVDELGKRVRKISLSGVSAEDKTGHDWEFMYQWLVNHAVSQFDLVTRAIEDWDGPADVDLGDLERGAIQYLDQETQTKLELQYAQAAIASCYAADTDTEDTVRFAHMILARLAILLDFVPPPDLATSVESLPQVERTVTSLGHGDSGLSLTPDGLLSPDHPLTSPKLDVYMLLQMMVYSAYQLGALGHPYSLLKVAKLYLRSTEDEQLEVLRKILRHVSKLGLRKDDPQWLGDRAKLLWLWNWGIAADKERPDNGSGVLGKISKTVFEEEMLKTFTEASAFDLVAKLYINHTPELLPRATVERVILGEAMKAYDGASNGNKSRGGVRKANEILTAFRSHFPDSTSFRQASALITATHALSFYSLTLQHGVPFQPVNIRVSHDPISLLSKVLEQNPRSYTKLDDLVEIAQNFVAAGLPTDAEDADEIGRREDLPAKRKDAERRVTFMAVEAALREDDFETAYSYIVNRLTPSGADIQPSSAIDRSKQTRGHAKRISQIQKHVDDDMSWRAAFLAGRYRPAASAAPSLRRLEQRTELLSLALLLAPVSALTEILAAWRRCEEEMTLLQASQQAAEDDFDDKADKRLSSEVPGNFTFSTGQPDLVLNQKRREVGRMGHDRGDDEAPLSMFDLTRNAARAFGGFPIRSMTRSSTEQERENPTSTDPSSPTQDPNRVRKRDMVANAVGGGLASGLGWVLGATPVNQQQR